MIEAPQEHLQVVAYVFTKATVKTLQIQCQYAALPRKPQFLHSAGNYKAEGGIAISAIITLTGNRFNGKVAICYSKEVFCALLSAMLGAPCSEMGGELDDSAGEILNMIFGYAKGILDSQGFSFDFAIPKVIKGGGELLPLQDGPQLVVPFTCKDGYFEIRLQAKK